MAGVAGGLLDQVQEDPAHGTAAGVGTPGCRGQRYRAAQVFDGPDDTIGLGGGGLVAGEHAGQGLAGRELEGAHVLGYRGGRVRVAGQRVSLDPGQPGPLAPGQVLDQAAQAERASGRRYARLLTGQAEAGVAHRLALMAEEGQQAVEFAGDRPGVHRHRIIMASGTDIACWPT